MTNCQNNDNYEISDIKIINEDPVEETFNFPESDNGFSTITGTLIVTDINLLPDSEDGIFLVPLDEEALVSTIPQFEISEVFQAVVNEINGEFTFTNIPIGKYAVVVLTQYGAQIPATNENSSSFVIFDVKESDLNNTIILNNIMFP